MVQDDMCADATLKQLNAILCHTAAIKQSSKVASGAPDPWTLEGGSQDGAVSFEEILTQISKARAPAVCSSPAKLRALASSALQATLAGASLRSTVPSAPPSPRKKTVPFKPVRNGQCFQTEGILHPRDLNAWDEERMLRPERTWSCKGATCKLYDKARAGKPDWNPTSWSRADGAFLPRPGLLTDRYPDTVGPLGSNTAGVKRGAVTPCRPMSASNSSTTAAKRSTAAQLQPASAATRRPASAPHSRSHAPTLGAAAIAEHSARGSHPVIAGRSRPTSASSTTGSRPKSPGRASSPPRQATKRHASAGSGHSRLSPTTKEAQQSRSAQNEPSAARRGDALPAQTQSGSSRPSSPRGRPNVARSGSRPNSGRRFRPSSAAKKPVGMVVGEVVLEKEDDKR